MRTTVSLEMSPADVSALAAQFALLADPLRLRIVDALSREQLCTCHLIEITGAKQTTVSHHLRLLREAGAVVSEAEGRFTWYRLTPGAFAEALRRLPGLAQATESTPRLRPACAV
jgi:ArsR family transcriptional regulator, arsenate/arsenite/antimonite-responsive transcriptional repressor